MGLFAGAALGAALQEGPKLLIAFFCKCFKFKPTRAELGSALERQIQVAQQLKQQIADLGRPEEEIGAFLKDLEAAEKILNAHSNVPWWQCCCLPWKQVKLQEALESLTRANTLLAPLLLRRQQETLSIVRELMEIGRGLRKRFGPPPKPDLVVGLGLENPFSLFNRLKSHLLEKGTSVLLLTGLAGYGKTTLATLLCSDEHVIGKFGENILFLTVSKSPNLKTLVQSLFQHHGCAIPATLDLADDRLVIAHLKNLPEKIMKSPMMLVLDDVWNGSQTQTLIDAFKVQQLSDYKILVTSRFNIAGFKHVFNMEPLCLEDSVTLLSHLTLTNEGISSSEKLDLTRQIAWGCYGSPLVLELVGGSLKRERLHVWKQVMKKLSKGSPVFKTDKELKSIFKKHLDDGLEDKPILKECFMDLGLFPEDQKIPVAALIDIWTEQQHKPDDDLDPRQVLKEAEAVNTVFDLTDRHLANLVIRRGVVTDLHDYCNHHFLMQHDLIREMIEANQEPYIQRKRLMFDMNENNWSQQNQQNTIASTLSISTSQMSTPELDNIVKAEVVEVLILNLRTKQYTFPEFIRKMVQLKVLIVTNYDDLYCSELNNFELLASLSGLKRIRFEGVSVTTFGKWGNLRKLSLYNCDLRGVFERDANILISDAFPILVELCIDYCKSLVKLPAELCDIISIKKLSITRCMRFIALPQNIGKLVNLKTLRLGSCAVFKEVPSSIEKLLQLRFLDISGCVSLDNLPDEIGNLRNLKRLHMIGCCSCKIPQSVMKLENLKDVRCDEETAVYWNEDFKPSFPNLNIEVAHEIVACSRWCMDHLKPQ
ncbi:hypothetical protein Fmac_014817 [Flemingia macrophylla]|uniref:Uncharacterized protein n=1 Tax=Flemingia macrophylla TaxID=520843 RepID=A0ABD1MCW4_9FABA